MLSEPVSEDVLHTMAEYYRARAGEYDEWWYRQGRFDRGPEANVRWFEEIRHVEDAFDAVGFSGDVLELAPGTGTWTERLLRTASSVTAVDASGEMIELNRQRVGSDRVRYVLADLFEWRPDRLYDGVCFGFWISHVPVERLDAFLSTVASALRPGAAVFFIDGRREPSSTAADHVLPGAEEQVMTRRLNDGREFRIVKNFYEREHLEERCRAAGLGVAVQYTPTYFIYGAGART